MPKADSTIFKGKGEDKNYYTLNQERVDKLVSMRVEKEQKAFDDINKEFEKAQKEQARLKESGLEEEYKKALEKSRDLYSKLLIETKKLEDAKENVKADAILAAQQYEVNAYKNASAKEKLEYQKKVKENALADKAAFEEKLKLLEAEEEAIQDKLDRELLNEEEKNKLIEKQKKISIEKTDVRSDLKTKDAQITSIEDRISSLFNKFATGAEKLEVAEKNRVKAQKNISSAQKEIKQLQEKLRKTTNKDQADDLKKQIMLKKEFLSKNKALLDEETENSKKAIKERNKDLKEKQKQDKEEKSIEDKRNDRHKTVAALANMSQNLINSNLNTLFDNQAKLTSRLRGTDKTWNKMMTDVMFTVGVSGVISQRGIAEKLTRFIDEGVAYNVELRGFIAEASQNIASTFDAFDSNLLRLIRLQQQDTTAARLGLETSLTELFNDYFSDSSYLNQTSDAVTGILVDASATMGRNESLAFEYIVQKWLGSLYSLGTSSGTIENLARGISYIATGDVSSLSSNTALQQIFSMASTKTEKTYTELLQNQLTAKDTNDLLKGVIEYLAEIANNQTDYVTKSAYANLLGMSITDLSSFASLTEEEIKSLHSTTQTYDTLISRTQAELSTVAKKMSPVQLVNTFMDNVKSNAGATIGSNPITFALWEALNLVSGIADVEIPGIAVVGNGTTSAIDIINYAKLAFGGLGLLGSIVSGVASISKGGAMSLDAWDSEASTKRGGGLSLLSKSSDGVSASEELGRGSSSGSDVNDVSFDSAKESALDSAGTSSSEFEEDKDIYNKIYEAISDGESVSVLTILQSIDDQVKSIVASYTSATPVAGSSSSTLTQLTTLTNNSSEQTNETSTTVSSNTDSSNVTATGGEDTSKSNSNALFTNEEQAEALQNIISAAVEIALTNIAGYSSGSGLPVNVTNINSLGV